MPTQEDEGDKQAKRPRELKRKEGDYFLLIYVKIHIFHINREQLFPYLFQINEMLLYFCRMG